MRLLSSSASLRWRHDNSCALMLTSCPKPPAPVGRLRSRVIGDIDEIEAARSHAGRARIERRSLRPHRRDLLAIGDADQPITRMTATSRPIRQSCRSSAARAMAQLCASRRRAQPRNCNTLRRRKPPHVAVPARRWAAADNGLGCRDGFRRRYVFELVSGRALPDANMAHFAQRTLRPGAANFAASA